MSEFTLSDWVGIYLPQGATFVEASTFWTSTLKPNDTFTERLVVLFNGRNVQILRYNNRNDDVVVFIGRSCKTMEMEDVGDYIRSNTK